MANPLRYNRLRRILRKHDARFEFLKNRGKGSHLLIYHPDIGGRAVSLPIPRHRANPEVDPGYIRDIIRHFSLPEDIFSAPSKKKKEVEPPV